MQLGSGSVKGFCMKIWYCSVCSKPSYNVYICKEAGKLSNLFVFSLIIVIFQCCSCIIENSIQRVVESV